MTSPLLFLFGTMAIVAVVWFVFWLSKPSRMLRLISFMGAAYVALMLVVITAGMFFGFTDASHGR